MALSVNWATGVITVPQADLTLVVGALYEHDTDAFWAEIKSIEASEEGIVFDDIQDHNSTYSIAGVTYAQKVEIIAPYSVQYENTGGNYSVRLTGSNNNLFDVENGILVPTPGVTIIGQNSAGLIVTQESGLTAAESAALLAIDTNVTSMLATLTDIDEREIGEHITNPATGKVVIRNTTALRRWEANGWEDVAKTIPYRGKGLEVVEDLVEVAYS